MAPQRGAAVGPDARRRGGRPPNGGLRRHGCRRWGALSPRPVWGPRRWLNGDRARPATHIAGQWAEKLASTVPDREGRTRGPLRAGRVEAGGRARPYAGERL